MGYTSNVNGLELYKNAEFSVVVGNPKSSLALCVVWQDVEKVVESNPEFAQKFAIIGNLRSPFGVNVILYNLALNPQIRNVVVWGPDKLSNTNIGLSGKNALLSLWRAGFDTQGQIMGTPFKLVEEIDLGVAAKVLKGVGLHEMSDKPRLDMAEMPKNAEEKYMEPFKFSEFVVKAPDVLPSEGFAYHIRDKKGADAYAALLYHIWRYGKRTPIDAGGEDVKEIRCPVVVVEAEDPENIFVPDWLLETKALGINKESLDNYYRTQFTPEPYQTKLLDEIMRFERPKDYSYLYAELMFAFPRAEEVTRTVNAYLDAGDYKAAKSFILLNSKVEKLKADALVEKVEKSGLGDRERATLLLDALIPPTDQVANIIERIKRKKEDLDKEMVLWDSRYHSRLESGRPCLFKFSYSVRDGKIDVHVFVRSHDVAQAWFFNFYGIARLLGKIAKETGFAPGMIAIESQSAHIYQRDWGTVEKLIKKRFDDAPVKMYFDEFRDLDPRGIVNVNVVNGMIKLKLQNPKTGETLFEAEGKTARQMVYKIKHHYLLSRMDHAAFVGAELAKAEMCIKLGVDYKYDTTIELPNGEKLVS